MQTDLNFAFCIKKTAMITRNRAYFTDTQLTSYECRDEHTLLRTYIPLKAIVSDAKMILCSVGYSFFYKG